VRGTIRTEFRFNNFSVIVPKIDTKYYRELLDAIERHKNDPNDPKASYVLYADQTDTFSVKIGFYLGGGTIEIEQKMEFDPYYESKNEVNIPISSMKFAVKNYIMINP
jgi:hypothetical protein